MLSRGKCTAFQMVVTRSRISPEPTMRPVLRWAGGKFNLSRVLLDLLPKDYERLVEPMVGGGALFFASQPAHAILADLNEDLINFYKVLSRRPDALVERLLDLKASRSKYYELRNAKPRSNIGRAVRFAYLNRLCWNGVYRVNQSGEFNVPIGNRLPTKLWDSEHLRKVASVLRCAELVWGDFESTLEMCREGDVVYLDPPYPKKRKGGLGFNRYTQTPFTLGDHHRLSAAVVRLHRLGVRLIISIPSSKEFMSIYPKDFRVSRIRSASLISCNGHSRGKTSESILRNFH